MNAMNMVTIMGRLTAEPELKFTHTNGLAVCTFHLAVDRPYRKDEEKETDFFRVVAWRGIAEFVCKYFHKGDPLLLTGTLRNNKYTLEGETQPRITTEIIAKELFFTSGRKKTEPDTTDGAGGTDAPSLSGVDLSEFEEICSGEDVPF